MCFCAEASFAASVLLAGAGVYAIKKAQSPGMLALASAPLLFAVQQAAEGFLWVAHQNPAFLSWQKPSIYAFLLIAQVVWPIWAPLAVWLIEPDKSRKKIISWFVAIGGITSLYMLFCLFYREPSALIDERHIRYSFYNPWVNFRRVFYFLAAVVPIFISSFKWMKLLGAVMLGSMIFSYIFFTRYVISVWCFFAAVLSILIILVVATNRTGKF